MRWFWMAFLTFGLLLLGYDTWERGQPGQAPGPATMEDGTGWPPPGH